MDQEIYNRLGVLARKKKYVPKDFYELVGLVLKLARLVEGLEETQTQIENDLQEANSRRH